MSTVQKIFVVIVFVLAAVFTFLTLQMMALEQNWKEKFVKETGVLNEKIAKLDKEKTEAQGQIENLKTANNELTATKRTLTEEKNTIDTLNGQLTQNLKQSEETAKSLSEENQDLRKQLADTRAKLDETNTQYLAEKKRAEDLVKIYQFKQDELADVIAELNDLKSSYRTMQEGYKKSEEELQSMRTVMDTVKTMYNIDIVKIMTEPQQPAQPIEGKVVAVAKDKDTGITQLVMLSVGRNERVERGQTFVIFRSDKYIGKVVVDKVFDDMATASVVPESLARDKDNKPVDIQQYDSASTRVY
jgi:chromosome segregation ATPase